MVEAGITPKQALKTATYNSALFLGKLDTLGAVEPGKLADLVLLDGNPLDDLHNTARISTVIFRGAVIAHPVNAHAPAVTDQSLARSRLHRTNLVIVGSPLLPVGRRFVQDAKLNVDALSKRSLA